MNCEDSETTKAASGEWIGNPKINKRNSAERTDKTRREGKGKQGDITRWAHRPAIFAEKNSPRTDLRKAQKKAEFSSELRQEKIAGVEGTPSRLLPLNQ
jgi:nickel-dependent lactate racemase